MSTAIGLICRTCNSYTPTSIRASYAPDLAKLIPRFPAFFNSFLALNSQSDLLQIQIADYIPGEDKDQLIPFLIDHQYHDVCVIDEYGYQYDPRGERMHEA